MKLNNARRIAYLGGAFSIGVYSAFSNYTMALWLTNFTTSYVVISLLGNTKSIEGAIVSPLVGVWSDRTWAGWLGRRRPFILVGGLLSATLVALTPVISRVPVPKVFAALPVDNIQILPIIMAVFLFTLTFNMADDLHKALRADLVEDDELNSLSSLATVVDIGAQVVLLALGFVIWNQAVPDSAFLVAGLLVALGVVTTTVGIQEPAPDLWAAREGSPGLDGQPSSVGRMTLKQYRGAVMFCLVTFAYWSGVNAVLPLVSIYVRDILRTTTGEAQLLPGLLLLSTAIVALPVGRLASAVGKRRTLACGYLIMALAAVAGLLITTKEQGVILFLVAGIGNAPAVVLAIPLMSELVPKQQIGGASGLLAAAGSIAAPLAGIAGGALSQVYGPRAIFAVMAVMISLAMTLLLGVAPPNTPSQSSRSAHQPR